MSKLKLNGKDAPKRAVFFDKDGVINDLTYNREEGIIGSPRSAKELDIFPYAAPSIKEIQSSGYLTIVISNQPGVGKKQFSLREFQKMQDKVDRALSKEGCRLDGEYYCFHHPSALISKYKVDCDCRKPKPGLFFKAAIERNIVLQNSFFIGDALIDVKAGKAAGCKTILVGHYTDFLNRMMKEEDAFPDHMIPSLKEAPKLLRSLEKSMIVVKH